MIIVIRIIYQFPTKQNASNTFKIQEFVIDYPFKIAVPFLSLQFGVISRRKSAGAPRTEEVAVRRALRLGLDTGLGELAPLQSPDSVSLVLPPIHSPLKPAICAFNVPHPPISQFANRHSELRGVSLPRRTTPCRSTALPTSIQGGPTNLGPRFRAKCARKTRLAAPAHSPASALRR